MTRNHPVTRSDILGIAGPLDDTTIAEIVATKATVAELVEARQWVQSNDTPELHRPSSARVRRLCELLDQPALDDEP